MNTVGLVCAALLGATGLVCLVRIVRGPTMLDRTLASDVFVAATLGAIGVEAAVNQHTSTLPILMSLSLIAFMGSVAIARYSVPDQRRSGTPPPEDAP